MTLAQRIVCNTVFLTGGTLLVGGGVVAGLLGLQRLSASTREEFEELREVRLVQKHLSEAVHAAAQGRKEAALLQSDRAIDGLREFEDFQQTGESVFDERHGGAEHRLAMRALAALKGARSALESGVDTPPPTPQHVNAFHDAEIALAELVDEIEHTVAVVHERAANRYETTFWALSSLLLLMAISGFVISLLHYTSVMGPLRRLRDGARRLAKGAWSTRLEPRGDREFVDLQQDFNRMAGELESLYRDLERRVAEQSRQLADAERLASVGYLAAGVAHEINNPLAIMSGYAESLLRRLRERVAAVSGGAANRSNGVTPSTTDVASLPDGDFARDLETIRDEAFRCKRITQGLLDLSKMGDRHREPVSLGKVVEDCTRLIRSSPMAQGRCVEWVADGADSLTVSASELELKQVVLNLATNALQAVSPSGGRVVMRTSRRNGWAELLVCDDGCGMTPETLERAFEPFFSASRNSKGVGLGLAISQAIAQRHGGTLTAQSGGLGGGSVLILRLPALADENAMVRNDAH